MRGVRRPRRGLVEVGDARNNGEHDHDDERRNDDGDRKDRAHEEGDRRDQDGDDRVDGLTILVDRELGE